MLLLQLLQLLRTDAAIAAALVVFAVDDPGSRNEAEKILKQLAADHFLNNQVIPHLPVYNCFFSFSY